MTCAEEMDDWFVRKLLEGSATYMGREGIDGMIEFRGDSAIAESKGKTMVDSNLFIRFVEA